MSMVKYNYPFKFFKLCMYYSVFSDFVCSSSVCLGTEYNKMDMPR